MADTKNTAAPKRKSVRKPAGPKPIYTVYNAVKDDAGNFTGEINVSKLTTNAEEAMLALVANPDNRFHRGELQPARRGASADEGASAA